MQVDIRDCVRCCNDHYQLEFEELYLPIDYYTYWASCPDTGQPVLLKTELLKRTGHLEDARTLYQRALAAKLCEDIRNDDGEAIKKIIEKKKI